MRVLDNEYKLRQNIKIAMLYLEDDDAINAEAFIKKAASLITSSKVSLQHMTQTYVIETGSATAAANVRHEQHGTRKYRSAATTQFKFHNQYIIQYKCMSVLSRGVSPATKQWHSLMQ